MGGENVIGNSGKEGKNIYIERDGGGLKMMKIALMALKVNGKEGP